MPKHPLVSVIIPAYNAEAYIDEALRSVLAQSYPNIEIIAVDDGSTDATSQRVAAYGRRIRYIHQPNSGGFPGIPRNTGMRESTGEYISYLDADDIMLPDRLQAQVDFFKLHPEVGCVFGDYRNFSASGHEERSHFQTCSRLLERLRIQSPLVLSSVDATALLLRENIGLSSSLMIRSEVLNRVPGFPTEIRIGEDFHFYYCISRCFSLGVIDQILTHRRLHNSNLTSDSLRTLKDHLVSFLALLDSEPNLQNVEALDARLHESEMDLARVYSNKREYRLSIMYNLRAIKGVFPWHLPRLARGLRSFLRTAMIATHLKYPTP